MVISYEGLEKIGDGDGVTFYITTAKTVITIDRNGKHLENYDLPNTIFESAREKRIRSFAEAHGYDK